MEDIRRSDFEVKDFDEVMDFMLEDDDLIVPSADPFLDSGNQMKELNFDFESMEGLTLVDSSDNEMRRELVCQPFDSLELEAKNRNRKCNLRKSLAWDSAFLTSAGVLDPDELSSMIRVAESGGRKALPGIQEGDMRSSVSTLDSDSITLESLEAELFQDIRASIQKSNKDSSPGESHISIHSLEKTDHSSGSKTKLALKNTTKKLTISATESLSKRNKSHSEVTKENHGGKCKGRPLVRTKLPNGPGKPSAIPFSPAKRVSVSANHITSGKNVPKHLVGVSLAKLPASSKPALPRPTAGGKTSVSVFSSGTKEHGVICSSVGSSSNVPSSSSAKSPLDSLNKNIASEATKPAATLIVGISSRIKSKDCNPAALQTTVEPVHSRLSACVKSTTTNLSGISPASSFSDWSNKSSSSTSTVYQRACSEASPLSMSGSGEGDYSFAFDLQEQSRDSKIGSDTTTVSNLSKKVKNGPNTHISLPHPVAAKPSGLRMPSPKIGFFDGIQVSLTRTPKRSVQVNMGMPKGEGIRNPTGDSSNGVIRKIQPSSQKRDDAQSTASLLKHVPHIPGRKLPHGLKKKASNPEAANHDASLSSKLDKKVSPKTSGKSPFDMAEVVSEGKSHDRLGGQKNYTRFGVVSGGEDSITRMFLVAEDSAWSMDKFSSRIDLPEIENFVKKKEATSETASRQKGSLKANSKGLNQKSAPVIIGGSCKDGEAATCGHQVPELNIGVNSDNGSQNLPITSSNTVDSKNETGRGSYLPENS